MVGHRSVINRMVELVLLLNLGIHSSIDCDGTDELTQPAMPVVQGLAPTKCRSLITPVVVVGTT